MNHRLITFALAAIIGLLSGMAQAKPAVEMTNDGKYRWSNASPVKPSKRIAGIRHRRVEKSVRHVLGHPRASEQILPHPSGCPSRSFCGCAAAVRLFGRPIRSLWLAANWFQFPHASPAPGMVAVRRHHVFVIEKVYDDGTVLAYDGNSGRHLTRTHRRSLSGYSVRKPHAV